MKPCWPFAVTVNVNAIWHHAGPRRCNSLCIFASLTLNGKFCWPAHNAGAEKMSLSEIYWHRKCELRVQPWKWMASHDALPRRELLSLESVCVCVYRNFLSREYDIHSFLPYYECHFPFEPSWRWWKWLKAECCGYYLPHTPLGLISGLGFVSRLWQMNKICG